MLSVKLAPLLIVLMTSPPTLCQRGSYAGGRPSHGYKDKFRPAVSAADEEVANRFGEDLPFNASQKPPVGITVVNAEDNYIPIRTETGSRSDAAQSNDGQIQTNRLPYDAMGDEQLVNYLHSLPVDKRPFWLVNYQAIEAHRNGSFRNEAFNPVASRGSFGG